MVTHSKMHTVAMAWVPAEIRDVPEPGALLLFAEIIWKIFLTISSSLKFNISVTSQNVKNTQPLPHM